MSPARDLDVVVFGATGVTGREVARYLATGTGARWGAAGRDPAKLERTLADVGASPPRRSPPTSATPTRSRAWRRGRGGAQPRRPLHDARAPGDRGMRRGGAHYVDLTGEIPFVRDIVAEFDVRATEAEVKIVQVCGFEALPPDLAVQLAAATARERWEAGLGARRRDDRDHRPAARPPRPSDGISGGTLQSMAEVVGSTTRPRSSTPRR